MSSIVVGSLSDDLVCLQHTIKKTFVVVPKPKSFCAFLYLLSGGMKYVKFHLSRQQFIACLKLFLEVILEIHEYVSLT
jgi:hypothetical protein